MKLVASFAFVGLAACQPEPSSCILDIGVDISNVPVHIYNNTLRGTNGMFTNITHNCAGGGTVKLSGTVNSSTTAYNFTGTATMCVDNNLKLDGQFQASSDGTNDTVIATALHIYSTTESSCKADPIDATCDIDVISSSTTVTDVTVCGLTYP